MTIVVTHPGIIADEAAKISRLLETRAADYMHIRKPDLTPEAVTTLLLQIPERFHPRLRLHDHHGLLVRFPRMGAHLNERCPAIPPGRHPLTRSCHSLREALVQTTDTPFDYVTLSPVFDSISKKGYLSRFNLTDLKGQLEGHSIVALGGVTPAMFSRLYETGFRGAAMLGYVWNHPDLEQAVNEILYARKRLDAPSV